MSSSPKSKREFLLTAIIEDFMRERGLPFHITEMASYADAIHSNKYDTTDKCRALIWRQGERIDYVTIYDENFETKSYTAVGDRRCDLNPADPNFFEQLEYHLLLEKSVETWNPT